MNDYHVNCLILATKKAQIGVIDMLITCGVDLGYVDRNGNNALHIACQSGHYDIVKRILTYYFKSNRNRKLDRGKTLASNDLNSTFKSNQINLTPSYTLKKKALSNFSIDCVDNKFVTCLMKAAMKNHYDIVELLLNFGANPRIENN